MQALAISCRALAAASVKPPRTFLIFNHFHISRLGHLSILQAPPALVDTSAAELLFSMTMSTAAEYITFEKGCVVHCASWLCSRLLEIDSTLEIDCAVTLRTQ